MSLPRIIISYKIDCLHTTISFIYVIIVSRFLYNTVQYVSVVYIFKNMHCTATGSVMLDRNKYLKTMNGFKRKY